MLAAIIIAIALLAALGSALRAGRKTIVRTPYNNRYNDAAGARDGRL